MFRSLFQSKWSKFTVPEIQESEGCANVVIWDLECERSPTGKYRFVSDWGIKFVEWLNAKWKVEGNHPFRIISNSPDESTVSIPGYKDCRVRIQLKDYADEHQLFSDVLDAIIDGMKAIENKSKQNNPNNAIHRMATRVTPRAWVRWAHGVGSKFSEPVSLRSALTRHGSRHG